MNIEYENLPIPFEIVNEITILLTESKSIFTITLASYFVIFEIDTFEGATFGSFVSDSHDKSRIRVALFYPCTLIMKCLGVVLVIWYRPIVLTSTLISSSLPLYLTSCIKHLSISCPTSAHLISILS